MRTDGFKFDIEQIADTILFEVEKLMTEAKIIVDDYKTLDNKFWKIKDLKKKYNCESIDIVFIWQNSNWDEKFDKQTYKKEIAELYNRLNYKISESKEIPTFFRGGEAAAPSFHFPAGLNIWFLEAKQFVKSKVKPIVVVDFGAKILEYLKSKLDNKENKKLFDDLKYYFVEVNNYFNYEKQVEENWNKK